MKKIYFCIISFIVLASVSCKNDLFPFDAYEPLILDPTQGFDAKRLNKLCEIQYFEESLFSDLIKKKPIQDNYIYKAFKEWNTINSNIKFAYQPDLTKCNLLISKNSNVDLAYISPPDDLGLIRIDESITDIKNAYNSSFGFVGLSYTNENYTWMVLPSKNPDFSDDRRLDRRTIMYFIGKYLGLPDSKDRNSCMYPYLVKDGTIGVITEEDKNILNTLYPYSPCGNIEVEIKSTNVNNDGSANLSVSYTNSNTKEKVYGCGVIVSEDSTVFGIEKNSFYYFQKNNLNDNTYSGKISKLNAQTKYYVRAFSLDANGIAYGKKITTLSIPNRQYDKWVTLPLDKNIPFTTEFNSYFEYEGKLYLGLIEKGNSEGDLYQYDPSIGKVKVITVTNFPNLSNANYNKLFYANGYIYVLNRYYSINADTGFKRLSLKTFKWEILPSLLGDFRANLVYGYTIFSNDLYLYLVTRGPDNEQYFQRYDIQKNNWTLLSKYKTNELSPYDGLYYNYNHFLNNPYYANNQFYFLNSNFKKSYDYINDKWNDFIVPAYTNSDVFSNQNLYHGFQYTDTYTLQFKNQILKYYVNHNSSRGFTISDLNGSRYEYITYTIPNPYDALKSDLNNFDRQLLVTIDVDKKITKEFCNPSDNVKLRHLGSSSGNTFIIATNDNIYMGLIDPKTNLCTGILKYIP